MPPKVPVPIFEIRKDPEAGLVRARVVFNDFVVEIATLSLGAVAQDKKLFDDWVILLRDHMQRTLDETLSPFGAHVTMYMRPAPPAAERN
jgi:hypothetical protein